MANPSTSERGTPGGVRQAYSPTGAGVYEADPLERTWELKFPHSVAVYDRMRSEESHIGSVLKAIKLALKQAPWSLDDAGVDPRVAAFVRSELGLVAAGEARARRRRQGISFLNHVDQVCHMLWAGFMVFEQVYEIGAPLPDQEGFDRDVVHLRKLAPRLPRTIQRITVHRDGGIRHVEQKALNGNTLEPIRLGVDQVVVYSLDMEGADWYGRALTLDTPIPTPAGWTTMGEVQTGDRVFDETGAVVPVTAKSQVWKERPTYRVEFANGESILADENHQWLSHVRVGQKRQPKLVTTKEMSQTLKKYGQVNHAIPLTGELDTPEADLPLDPYVLGAWLGDGSTKSNTIVDAEGDVIAEIERRGHQVTERTCYERSKAWRISGLRALLRTAGVLENKRIPEVYLRSSGQQRLDLLRGLMDTDGHVDPANRQVIFSNTNKDVIDGVVDLVRGLGAKAKVQTVNQAGSVAVMKNGNKIHSRKDIYRVKITADFCVFNMKRKAEKQHVGDAYIRPYHYVKNVVRVDDQDTVCIEVGGESHLFLAGKGMIPTHNSMLRNSYKNWLVKDMMVRLDAQAAERNSMGVPEVTYDPQQEGQRALAEKLVREFRAGQSAGVPLPEGMTFNLKGVQGSTVDLVERMKYHDQEMGRAALAMHLDLGHDRGSQSLGETFRDVFMDGVQAVADTIAETMTEHVVRDLVEWNFGADEPYPTITPGDLKASQGIGFESMKTLTDAGILRPDDELEDYVRTRGGLPERDTETVRVPSETTANAETAGALVRAGFDPTAAAEAAGLGDLRHIGLPPVTVHPPRSDQPPTVQASQPALSGLDEMLADLIEDHHKARGR